MKKGKLSDVDFVVAQRFLAARLQAGKTQEETGAALGVTFQQVQKYERCHNRVSIATLCRAAQFFGVKLTDLLAGLDTPDGIILTTPLSPQAVSMARSYDKLPDYLRATAMLIIAGLRDAAQ